MAPGWLSDVLHVVLGGAIGSSVAFGLSWLREHRRTTDAYRAPQRQAIGELIAAAHELQLRILNFRADLSDLIDDMRQDRTDDLGSLDVRLRQSRSAYAAGLLGMRRAMDVGSLTIVDAQCWDALASVATVFARIADESPEVVHVLWDTNAEQKHDDLEEYAAQLRVAMVALVRAANDRVGPADTRRNQRRRRAAQRRLAEQIQADAAGESERPPA